MTNEELAAIRVRYEAVTDETDRLALIEDVPALLAEVARLRKACADAIEAHIRCHQQRGV